MSKAECFCYGAMGFVFAAVLVWVMWTACYAIWQSGFYAGELSEVKKQSETRRANP